MAADLLPGFDAHWIDVPVGRIFARSAGHGPPVVLLHGFPQTLAMWRHVAPALAETHRVVCMDLRGYGWSSAPRGDPRHDTYAKRAMAADVIAVMERLGHVHFAVVGHDRGARVGYRLALDHPGRVERLALLDILPTVAVWRAIKAGSGSSPHWVFLARPAPAPETEIGRDPIGYVDGLLAQWSGEGTLDAFGPALAAYHASCNEPSRIHAFCEDYRAGATRDLEADEADLAAGRVIACPTLLLWGDYLAKGAGATASAPAEAWARSFAPRIAATRVAAGHFLAEENPAATLTALREFLR